MLYKKERRPRQEGVQDVAVKTRSCAQRLGEERVKYVSVKAQLNAQLLDEKRDKETDVEAHAQVARNVTVETLHIFLKKISNSAKRKAMKQKRGLDAQDVLVEIQLCCT